MDDHCFAVRRELFVQVGGFFPEEKAVLGEKLTSEEKPVPGAERMLDFCLRLRALGYRHMVSPYAPMHLNTDGRKNMMCDQIKSRVPEKEWGAFCEKYGIGAQDPYYRKA